MQTWMPLLLIAFLMALALVVTFWPWLTQRGTRDKAVTLCLSGFFLTLALYLALGSPFQSQDIAGQQEAQEALRIRIAELEALRQSQDLTALQWAELGAAYMGAAAYPQAEEALRHAVTASGGEPHLIMAYGKAQMLAADGTITEGAKEAFAMASTLMPDNPEPLFLLAVERMQAGDKQGATARFEALLPKLPPQAPLRRIIDARLQEMEK